MVIVIVENNRWSLATKDKDRRCGIDLKKIADSLHIKYLSLTGNDPIQYSRKIKKLKKDVILDSCPALIEVNLTTLGSWWLRSDDCKDGKFINYHAGPAPEAVSEEGYPILEESEEDPLYLLKNYLDFNELVSISNNEANKIKSEIR